MNIQTLNINIATNRQIAILQNVTIEVVENKGLIVG